jgi:hypothetical protein
MFKHRTRLGPVVALAISAGALMGCDQYSKTSSDADAHRDVGQAQSGGSQRVEKRAEHASRDLARRATALVEGVKKGVHEGVQEGRRDAHAGRDAGDHPQDQTDRHQDQDASQRRTSDE